MSWSNWRAPIRRAHERSPRFDFANGNTAPGRENCRPAHDDNVVAVRRRLSGVEKRRIVAAAVGTRCGLMRRCEAGAAGRLPRPGRRSGACLAQGYPHDPQAASAPVFFGHGAHDVRPAADSPLRPIATAIVEQGAVEARSTGSSDSTEGAPNAAWRICISHWCTCSASSSRSSRMRTACLRWGTPCRSMRYRGNRRLCVEGGMSISCPPLADESARRLRSRVCWRRCRRPADTRTPRELR